MIENLTNGFWLRKESHGRPGGGFPCGALYYLEWSENLCTSFPRSLNRRNLRKSYSGCLKTRINFEEISGRSITGRYFVRALLVGISMGIRENAGKF